MSNNLKYGSLDIAYSFTVVFLPFLYLFKGIGNSFSLGELLVMIPLLIACINDVAKQRKLRVDGSLLLFYFVVFVTSLFSIANAYFVISKFMTILFRLLFYALLILFGRFHFHVEIVYKAYTFSVLCFSAYLVLQYVYFQLNNGYLPIYLHYSWQFPPEARPESLAQYYKWSFRPASLFLEPGYFCLFVTPNIILNLFMKNRSGMEGFSLVFALVAVVLSGSGAGIISLSLILGVYIFSSTANSSGLQISVRLLFIVLIIVVGYLYLRYNASGSDSVSRISDGGSFNQRVTRGLIIFRQLPFQHQIWGVGLNNLGAYMSRYGISTIYDETNLNYAASIIQVGLFSGIIGLASLLIYLGTLLARTVHAMKVMTSQSLRPACLIAMYLYLIVILSYEAVLFSYRFAFVLIIFEATIRFVKGNSSHHISEHLRSRL
ncbi:hypothetical protein [Lacticaseibacillus jixiensis]|uniref:hypothetical protein n=1 Tax=Lacticaseibacillus jixiensis TaxID=3231926 RepID=UPI0036F21A12